MQKLFFQNLCFSSPGPASPVAFVEFRNQECSKFRKLLFCYGRSPAVRDIRAFSHKNSV